MINAKVDLNTISLPPNTIVGYRSDGKAIYNIAGGSIEVEPDVDDPKDDDDDDDDDNDPGDEDTFVPPSKEQWEKLLAEKKKADSESAARKRLLRDAGINPKDGSPLKPTPKLLAVDDDDPEKETVPQTDAKRTVEGSDDAKALQKRLQREMERNLLDQEKEVRSEERGRAKALISALPEALQTEGWNGKAMPRILKLLDLDSVEVDEDGVTGLDDQVQELKRDFPEFFRRTRMKDAAEKVADRRTAGGGNKKTSPAKVDGTWAENIARALHGDG
jgi:hypothetical protein